ncbi:hypothetical protein EVAR_23515_1 [Eumeta japonica]|uniref:Uncharacterized protein n=1 Tax=Eumeta variegata TaxID=151549 RepID=A0A4C1W1V2_EUMVA|nr:hypothetical protein EVAR_23515_1 [Eumeta japonica]
MHEDDQYLGHKTIDGRWPRSGRAPSGSQVAQLSRHTPAGMRSRFTGVDAPTKDATREVSKNPQTPTEHVPTRNKTINPDTLKPSSSITV